MTEIEKIIELLGGSIKVADQLNRHQTSVQRWSRLGIPEELWSELILMAPKQLSPDRLHKANEEVRGIKHGAK